MNRSRKFDKLEYLGTRRGRSVLTTPDGRELGTVTYELDGFRSSAATFMNGRVEGECSVLDKAFKVGLVRMRLSDGASILVSLEDPSGDSTAEIQVNGEFPAPAASNTPDVTSAPTIRAAEQL